MSLSAAMRINVTAVPVRADVMLDWDIWIYMESRNLRACTCYRVTLVMIFEVFVFELS